MSEQNPSQPNINRRCFLSRLGRLAAGMAGAVAGFAATHAVGGGPNNSPVIRCCKYECLYLKRDGSCRQRSQKKCVDPDETCPIIEDCWLLGDNLCWGPCRDC